MMAASMGGAFKAMLESLGTGVPAYRDGKPADAEPAKWLVVQEGIGIVPDLDGDADDPNATGTEREAVQIDLWQHARAQTSRTRTVSTEDYVLPTTITRALKRPSLLQPHAPWRIYGFTGLSLIRWPISDNLLRHSWTVTVNRSIERLEP